LKFLATFLHLFVTAVLNNFSVFSALNWTNTYSATEKFAIRRIAVVYLQNGNISVITIDTSFETVYDNVLVINANFSLIKYVYAVRQIENIVTFRLEQIVRKCILFSGYDHVTNYIMPLVNNKELD